MSTEDWRWQLRNQYRTRTQLEAVFPLTGEERAAIDLLTDRFQLGITPYYLSLMDPDDPDCPIRRQAIPRLAEGITHPGESADPLAEERDMPVPGITHRYPNRALLYVTHLCAVYCRHCTRRRKVSNPTTHTPPEKLDAAVRWLADHPEVDDVVLSGGDPLSLSDARLDRLLTQIRPHVSIIRIGSRHPTTMPQRITPALCAVLAKHPPIFVMTHFNHPRECTPQAARACQMLVDAGCVLSNQTVLMRGINDDVATLDALHRWLLAQRCRPYRLYHCDFTEGVRHFRVPLGHGLELMDALRGPSSGLAMPEYMVDLPGGHGKVVVREGVRTGTRWTFRSWQGVEVVLLADGMDAGA
ncbi:MAG: lysine 2,3-aminomutase [Myxococcota bacterium]|jgi:lysine 2,3-aminomutase